MQIQTPKYERNCFCFDTAQTPNMDLGIPEEELLGLAFHKQLYDKVHRDKFSLLLSIDGRHRSGKSLYAVFLASLLDKTFLPNMERRIVLNAEAFLDEFERIEREHIIGAVVIVDEAGQSVSSMDWFDRMVKAVVKVVQIFGYLHPVVIFVAPVKDLVDSRLRKMSHLYMKVKRYNNEYTTITPYHIEYNTMRSKFFYKKPKVELFGQDIYLSRIRVCLPPKDINEQYKELEKRRKPILMKDIREEAKKSEIKEKRESLDIEEVTDFVVKNVSIFQSERSKPDKVTLDETLIGARFKTTQKFSRLIKILGERKLRGKGAEVSKLLEESK